MKNPKIEKELIQFLRNNNHGNDNSLYWYPLVDVSKSITAAAYDVNRIYQDNNMFHLESVVKLYNIESTTLFQMDIGECFENESISQLIYEQDNDGYIFPWYTETFLFDRSREWLIYLSHEKTISFTGKKIVTAAKQIIPQNYLIVQHTPILKV